MSKFDVLVSYAYLNERFAAYINDNSHRVNVYVDSGAFTAFSGGDPIPIKDYMAFCRSPPFPIERYFMLDVIGNADGTMANYKTMRGAGLTPVPIFSRGSPWSHLDYYAEQTDLISCGGLAVRHCNPLGYIKAIRQRVDLRRVHLLGFARQKWLPVITPYSCDASSWQGAKMYGVMNLYMGGNVFYKLARKDVAKMPQSVTERIRHYGVDPARLRFASEWSGMTGAHIQIEAASWLHYARDLRIHKGVRLFLVLVGIDHLRYLLNAAALSGIEKEAA